MCTPGKRQASGFTLFEVVVALAIISLVAISALALVAQQVHVAERAKQIVRAEVLADQRMALLSLLTSYELQSLPDTVANGRFPYPNDEFSWHVTSQPIMGDDNLNDVRVDVNWNDGTYTLRTRVYQPPGKDAGMPTTRLRIR
jgi:type II secretion system protein I